MLYLYMGFRGVGGTGVRKGRQGGSSERYNEARRGVLGAAVGVVGGAELVRVHALVPSGELDDEVGM
jgi:hypothetical protein